MATDSWIWPSRINRTTQWRCYWEKATALLKRRSPIASETGRFRCGWWRRISIITGNRIWRWSTGWWALAAGLWQFSLIIGDGTFGSATQFNTGISPLSIAAGDFNHDGNQDVWIGGNGTGAVLLGNGDGTFQVPTLYQTDSNDGGAFGVAVGDFDGDGFADIAAANFGSDTVGVLLNNGGGIFRDLATYPAGSGPDGLATADVNHDGKLDLIAPDMNSNSVSVLLGNGDGTFQALSSVTAGTGPSGVLVADLDGTGHLDLAIPDSKGDGVTVILGNGDGTFGKYYDFPSSSTNAQPGATSVAVGDFNGDGRLDLAVVNYNDSSVAILLGQKP